MSDVNHPTPLQLIRLRDNVFEVPQETKQFLRQIKNPLGVITIVGKYRTGKSLFLNKVLLKNGSFKVSPTINSCTKGLWMCRQTLTSEGSQPCDLIVVDTEGFGATEETDAYNNKILLFAILLSSYFIYNSVGSIDENSINNLNVIANLAREIQKSNSKDDKVDEEFPSFLWLVRDFTLNIVDKSGYSMQPKDYLEQALELLKGSSDAIENKNKVRRMIKSFFKDRDCFTLVRPVETEDQLQKLYYLNQSQLRPQFLDQAATLRSKIMKKVRSKKIRGKTLDGQMLLQLAMNYVDVINKGNLPNFDSSYKIIMKFQLNRLIEHFTESCKQRFKEFGKNMRPKEEFDLILEELYYNAEQKFREGTFEAEITKLALQRVKKDIKKQYLSIINQNQEKMQKSCLQLWQTLYTKQLFDDESQLIIYFEKIQNDLKKMLEEIRNPIDSNFYKVLISEEKNNELQALIKNKSQNSSKKFLQYQTKIGQLQHHNKHIEKINRQTKDHLHELTRQHTILSARFTQYQKHKEEEIGFLRQKEADNLRQIERIFMKNQQCEREIDRLHKNCSDLQERFQQSQRWNRQYDEEKKQLQNQLQSLNQILTQKNQEIVELKMKLGETTTLLKSTIERQSLMQAKSKSQSENRSVQMKYLQTHNEQITNQLKQLSKKAAKLEQQLKNGHQSIFRERSIYENMFQSFKQSLKSESNSRQELIQTNKNLSSALKHVQNRALQAEEKVNQLKQYKKCVKNSSCLQCHNCAKFFVPSIFIPHLNVCLIGPDVLKNSSLMQPQQNVHNRLQVKIKKTLAKEQNNKSYTEYVIEFKRGSQTWTVIRKYKVFCELNATLKTLLPGVQLSQVSHIVNPEKFNKASLAIEERRKTLERYLTDLSNNHLVTSTTAWKEFIDDQSDHLQLQPLTENRKFSNPSNSQQTPQQYFKQWNQRKLRGKQLSMSKKFKPNV